MKLNLVIHLHAGNQNSTLTEPCMIICLLRESGKRIEKHLLTIYILAFGIHSEFQKSRKLQNGMDTILKMFYGN